MFNNSNELFTINDFFVYLSYGCVFITGVIVGLSQRRRRRNLDKERMDWLESVRPRMGYIDGNDSTVFLYRTGNQKFETLAPTIREAITKTKGGISG